MSSTTTTTSSSKPRKLVLDTDLLPSVSVQSQIYSSVSLQLASLGSARKASTLSAIQAASAALALVRETKSSETVAYQSALAAARATRALVLVCYVDAILDRASHAAKEDAHLERMFGLCRDRVLVRGMEQELNWPGTGALLASILFTADLECANAAEVLKLERDQSETLSVSALRSAILDVQRLWANKSLAFRETCLLAKQQQACFPPSLLCGIMACAFNLSRRQNLGGNKIRVIVQSVMEDGGADVGARSACFATATAVDDLFNRFRHAPPIPAVVSTMPAPPARQSLDEYSCGSDELLSFANEYHGQIRSWLLEVALALAQLVNKLFPSNAPLPGKFTENVEQIRLDVIRLRANGRGLMAPVALVWEAVSMRHERRLFNDWTSEEETSEEEEEEEVDSGGAGRLNEIRHLASRYGVFQTTHPEDRQALLCNPAPVQLRTWQQRPSARAAEEEQLQEYSSEEESTEEED